jgi:Protein of unknown function (DUF3592)
MRGPADFWGPLIAGIFLIVIGGAETIKYLRFRRRAEQVPGVVVEMREGTNIKYGVLYYPVLEFTTRGGRQIRTTTRLGTRPPQAQVGDRVAVSYDPHNPVEAEIATKEFIRLVVALLLVFGGMCFMLAAGM